MSYLLYGETVREARKRCGLTQEELAYGICSVSTLSKIENGKRQPHILTFEALMQRMGVSGEGFFLCLSEQEMASCRLLQEINGHLWNGDADFQMPERGKRAGLFAKPYPLEEQWIGMAGQWFLFRQTIYKYTEAPEEVQRAGAGAAWTAYGNTNGPDWLAYRSAVHAPGLETATTNPEEINEGNLNSHGKRNIFDLLPVSAVAAAGGQPDFCEPQDVSSLPAVLSDIRSRTLELMRLTLPDCTGRWMEGRCFTYCELLGWLLLGFTNAWLGVSGIAYELGKELLRYTRGRETDWFPANLQAAVFLLLSRNFQLEGNWKDSAGFCSMGVELCLKCGNDHMAARLLEVLKICPAEYREMTGAGAVAGPGELLKE